jgi:threonine dehydrogenase-like Zn-dependent dehydrogenase
MRAVAVYPSDKRVSLVNDHPEPALESPTGVKLKMLEVGICGTDREICSFEYGEAPPRFPYLVLGHESFAEVVEVGSGVQKIKPGNLAVLSVRRPCPEMCPACQVGRQDFCYTGNFKERGINKLHGYMTELIVEDQQYVYVVPNELREIGVLTEPLTITEKAFDQLATIRARMPWHEQISNSTTRNALILGAGPVGLLAAMKMIVEGFTTYVYSLGKGDAAKERIMKEIGAQFVAAEDVKAPDVLEHCGGHVDVVIEALGAAAVSFEVLRSLQQNAMFVFTGVPGRKAPIPFDLTDLMKEMVLKNQLVFGTVNAGPNHFRSSISDLERFNHKFPQAVRDLITARISLDQYAAPIDNPVGIKNVIQVN